MKRTMAQVDQRPPVRLLAVEREFLGRVLQKLRDFVLDVFEFVQTQMNIGDNEDIAALGVFVDQFRPAFRFRGLDLF